MFRCDITIYQHISRTIYKQSTVCNNKCLQNYVLFILNYHPIKHQYVEASLRVAPYGYVLVHDLSDIQPIVTNQSSFQSFLYSLLWHFLFFCIMNVLYK